MHFNFMGKLILMDDMVFYRRAEHPDGTLSAHATIATLREEGLEGLKAGFTPFLMERHPIAH